MSRKSGLVAVSRDANQTSSYRTTATARAGPCMVWTTIFFSLDHTPSSLGFPASGGKETFVRLGTYCSSLAIGSCYSLTLENPDKLGTLALALVVELPS